ncbi:tetraacyldisaccharide 4'-kinase [Campylobacter gastrosuis]|uniref:Tetraacyldisaccharide 4'-kinase n=1 Tax=Campylobacter gastrosuis TaxID=2974576 RepID=A0ABT7HR27_9BACT|nr:tetraacyldisaccharide 4'-kinase [Campylobacter gastrosuis]MDL0089177.1 tetraacyldisaccharide 4'-kinase [Campylobacter gastrosuis]
MFKGLHAWAERYFYSPNFYQKSLALMLYPLSLIYKFIVILKQKMAREIDFKIPVISVGNLTLGGSGKTPLCIAILSEFKSGFVVLRGYKRHSKGLVKVAINGEILVNVKTSGDEAMEYAKSVPNANVIVSEDRKIAIEMAKKMGAKYILLDDGFGKFDIKKFNILIRPKNEPFFKFSLPAGAYRYPFSFYKLADFTTQDEITHFKSTEILNKTEKMVLVTAIANPSRLNTFLTDCIGHVFYPDHYEFKRDELVKILADFKATSLLMTQKDYVKVADFGINVSIIKLKTTLSPEFKQIINSKIL